jgi:hypothetical protein
MRPVALASLLAHTARAAAPSDGGMMFGPVFPHKEIIGIFGEPRTLLAGQTVSGLFGVL